MRNLDQGPFEPLRRRGHRGYAEELNQLSEAILGAAISVHRALEPGLLESVYETCLAYELARKNLPFHRQVPMPVRYAGISDRSPGR